MTLAIIAVLAALNTRSDYQFVDVQQIGVSGDKVATAGENVKGEHAARFYEWLAESKWIMEACGATIPSSLARWTPPTVHSIDSMQDAIVAYRDAMTSDASSPVRWVRGSPAQEYECYSASFTGEVSPLSVAEIATNAWDNFCSVSRYKPYDYSSYYYPGAVTTPDVASGAQITASALNQLNTRSTSERTQWLFWSQMGANRFWTAKHPISTTTRLDGSYYKTVYGPFYYYPHWLEKVNPDPTNPAFTHLTPRPYYTGGTYGGDYDVGLFTLNNIVKADIGDIVGTYTTRIDSHEAFIMQNGNQDIVGRAGITLDQSDIYLFICCWKCGYVNGEWRTNVKVIAKQVWSKYPTTISDAVDSVESQVEAVTGGEYSTSYVKILFAAHGTTWWIQNASESHY